MAQGQRPDRASERSQQQVKARFNLSCAGWVVLLQARVRASAGPSSGLRQRQPRAPGLSTAQHSTAIESNREAVLIRRRQADITCTDKSTRGMRTRGR